MSLLVQFIRVSCRAFSQMKTDVSGSDTFSSYWLVASQRRLKGVALLMALSMQFFSVGISAQSVISISGDDYEVINWESPNGFVFNVTGSWNGNGGGTIAVDAEFFAIVEPDPISFAHPIFTSQGISLTNVNDFRANMGQHNDKESLPPEDQTIRNAYTLAGSSLPTEVFYLLGGDPDMNGHKFTVHTWTSTQPDTIFELVSTTLGGIDVTGNNTGTLSYRIFDNGDPGAVNNRVRTLVRIANPSGVSFFQTVSNRLNNDGTIANTTPNSTSADLSGSAILVRLGPSGTTGSISSSSEAIPTLGKLPLAMLAGLLLMLVSTRREILSVAGGGR